MIILLADTIRLIHIVAGITGLFALWGPVFSQKGGQVHRWTGRVFEYCCYVVGVSGLISSTWWLSFPAIRPEFASRGKDELLAALPEIYFLFGLIFFLGVVLLSTTRFGVRTIRLGVSKHAQLKNFETKWWASVLMLTSVCLCSVGVSFLFTHGFTKHALFLTFPIIAAIDVRSKWRFASLSNISNRAVRLQHAECMTGSVIAFCTAFLVLGGNRLYGAFLPQLLVTATYLLPTILGVALFHIAKKKMV